LGRSSKSPAFGGCACPRCKYPSEKRFFRKKLENALKGGDLNPQSYIKIISKYLPMCFSKNIFTMIFVYIKEMRFKK